MRLNRLQDLGDCDASRCIRHKQQIKILFGFQLAFPFVFNRLDSVKLYQSLFDLVRSVTSQNLQPLIHSGDIKRNFA